MNNRPENYASWDQRMNDMGWLRPDQHHAIKFAVSKQARLQTKWQDAIFGMKWAKSGIKVRRIVPGLIESETVGVQPMSLKFSELVFFRPSYV